MDSLLHAGADENLTDFYNALIPYGEKSTSGTTLRREGFKAADSNGSSYISLAESELFIKWALQKVYDTDRSDFLWKTFRPSYIYAFNNAKDLHAGSGEVLQGAKTATTDDYVSFAEFRVFTLYLRIYSIMFDAFADIDGKSEGRTADDDMRLDIDEFIGWYNKSGGGPNFKAFEGIDTEDQARELFETLDADSSGKILFSEFTASVKEVEIVEHTAIGQLLNGDIKPTPVKKKEVNKGASTASNDRRRRDVKTPTKSSDRRPARGNLKTPEKKKASPKKKAMIMPMKVAAAYTPSKNASPDLKDFIKAIQPFSEKTLICGNLRKTAFKSADANGTGKCSLASISQHVKSSLKKELGIERGTEMFDLYRPSYIRAFVASKGIAKTGDPDDDNYINFAEFRVLNAYLCVYAGMCDAFMKVDGGGPGVSEDDDRRVEMKEWIACYDTFSASTFVGLTGINNEADATTVFGEMDGDGKGMVLLSEFCEYIRTKEIESKTPLGKLLYQDHLKVKQVGRATILEPNEGEDISP